MNDQCKDKAAVPVIAYTFITFPKITETFTLREMLKLQEHGVRLEVFSLLTPPADKVIHPEAQELAARTHYSPWLLSAALIGANCHFIRHRFSSYFGIMNTMLVQAIRQPSTFIKTLGIFPKSVFFARLCKLRGINHIHSSFASHNATCALIISELIGIPYSITLDAYDLYVETALLETKLTRASFVATISHFNIKVLEERYGEAVTSHTHHIPRGIDMNRFKPAPEKKQQREKQAYMIVCVASLQIKKGHRFLLHALAGLHDQGHALHCVLVGDGPLKNELRHLIAELGLGETVAMAGDQTQEEVIRWLQQADCFVLPSIIAKGNRMEGIPNVLMEAMACELPVISTTISGIPELVEHEVSGLLVPPEDADKLGAAIKRLLADNDLAREMGRQGRIKVDAEYNLIHNTEKLYTLYKNVIR